MSQKKLFSIFSVSILTLTLLPTKVAAFSNSQNALGDSRVIASAFENQNRQASCSGALIEPRIVMLAGHCTARKLNGLVVTPNYQGLPFSGEIPTEFNWVIYAPGVKVPFEGNKNKAKVIAQFLAPEYKDGGNGSGPTCDFAVLILEKALSNNYFKILDGKSLAELREKEAETLSFGYGYKSYPDMANAQSGLGRDPDPVMTKSFFRAQNLSDGSEKLEVCEGSTNKDLQVHVKLPTGVFTGSSDSGGPLWVKQNDEWIYVGAISGAVGLGINGATPQNSPQWNDANVVANSGVNYVTAQAFEKTIERAKNYLKEIELTEIKIKADAESKAKAYADLQSFLLREIQSVGNQLNILQQVLVKKGDSSSFFAKYQNSVNMRLSALNTAVESKNVSLEELAIQINQIKSELKDQLLIAEKRTIRVCVKGKSKITLKNNATKCPKGYKFLNKT